MQFNYPVLSSALVALRLICSFFFSSLSLSIFSATQIRLPFIIAVFRSTHCDGHSAKHCIARKRDILLFLFASLPRCSLIQLISNATAADWSYLEWRRQWLLLLLLQLQLNYLVARQKSAEHQAVNQLYWLVAVWPQQKKCAGAIAQQERDSDEHHSEHCRPDPDLTRDRESSFFCVVVLVSVYCTGRINGHRQTSAFTYCCFWRWWWWWW